MVFHLTRSIPVVVALAATVSLSLESRDEAVSSCAEDSSLSLVQRQSIRLDNTKRSSDLANATPASKASATQFLDAFHKSSKHDDSLKDVPTFYLYDDPVFTVTDGLHNCKEPINKKTWPSYVDILAPLRSQLEKHPRRVTEGSAAEWFIVPFDFDLSRHTGVCNGTKATERVNAAIDALQASTFFKKNNGTDHVLVAMLHHIFPGAIDWDSYFPIKHRALLQNMVIAHYIDHHLNVNDKVYGMHVVKDGSINGGWKNGPCDWRCTWLLPVQSAEGLWKEDESFEEWNKRPNTIFFRGRGKLCRDTGAEALRESAQRLQNIVPNVIINDTHADSFDQYVQEITSSKFCLVMRCDDPQTSRMVDSLAAGCIPVLISEGLDLVAKPFAAQVNYDAFAVSIDESAWMRSTLEVGRFAYNWSPQEMRRMHSSLQEARAQLLWNHPRSQVASVALRELSQSCKAL